ncbi:MAG: PAS domain S-box protein [Synergistaceae bacterium]|nr:PAS domain S-box protein [Synergistaceae bacterium]
MNRPFSFTEKHCREFIENTSELILCMDAKGCFVYVNRSWKEKMGYSEEEAYAMTIWDIIHPDHMSKCMDHLRKICEGDLTDCCTKSIETAFVGKDEKVLFAEMNSSCMIERCDEEKFVMCSFSDITFRKKAEEQITSLVTLVEQSDDMIAYKNMDFQVVAANVSYAKLAGYDSVKDIIGKNCIEIFGISPDSGPGKFYLDQDRKAQKLKPGEYLLVENILDQPKYKDRNILSKKFPILDSTGRVIGTGDIIRETTEFKKTQTRLYESQQHFKLLVDQMLHGLAVHEIICDENNVPVDYRFISVNKKFEEQTGLREKDVVGKTVLEVLPKTESIWIERYEKVALTGEPVQFDSYSAHFDKWYGVSSYSPKFGQFVVIMDDITERKKLEEALHLEKEQIEKTLLSVGDGVISTDKNGRIRLMNKAAENLTGWKLKNSLGMKIEDIYDIRDETTKEKIVSHFGRVLQKGDQINNSNHKLLISKNGVELYIEDSSAPIKDSRGNISGMILVFRDSTEKIERLKQVEYLSLHDHMTSLYNRKYMQDSIKRLDTKRNLPFSVIYMDVNGLKLVNDSLGHEMGDRLIVSVANALKGMLRSDDIVGRIGGDEFLVLLPKTDIESTERVAERIESTVSDTKIGSLVPSIALGCAVKTEDDQSILETLKRAEASMYKGKLKSSKVMRNSMIENLIKLLEEKYDVSKQHSKRVMYYCEKIAIAMGFTEKETAALKTTALLHNVGEVVVPASVLNKPEKLSEEEYEQIKIHSEKGYQILKSIDEYSALAESVLQHHERWDGKGYPDGLREGDILLHSRIINVADAYEAMTSERPYKKAMTQKEALNELKKCRGEQFDPEIVDIFIEKVLLKKNQYADVNLS